MNPRQAIAVTSSLLLTFLLLASVNGSEKKITGYWSYVGSPPTQFPGLASLAKGHGDTLFAGGDSGIAVWTGSIWNTLSKTPAIRIAYNSRLLFVAGNFTNIEGCAANTIAQWDGAKWRSLGKGFHFTKLQALTASPNGEVFVGGDFDSIGGIAVHFLFWNGTSWDTTGNGQFSSNVSAITCGDDGAVYVATQDMKIVKLKDRMWTDISPNVGPGYEFPYEINVLAAGRNGVLYAGGGFSYVNKSLEYAGIIKWDGASWSATKIGERVTDMALSSSGTVFAVSSNDFFNQGISGNNNSFDYYVYRLKDTTATMITDFRYSYYGSAPMRRCSITLENDSISQFSCGYGVIKCTDSVAYPLVSGFSELYNPAKYHAFFSGALNTFSCNNQYIFAAGRKISYNGNWIGSLARWDGTTWRGVNGADDKDLKWLGTTPDGNVKVCGSWYSRTDTTAFTIDILPTDNSEYGTQWVSGIWSAIPRREFPTVQGVPGGDYYRLNCDIFGSGEHSVYHGAEAVLKLIGERWEPIGTAKVTPKDSNEFTPKGYFHALAFCSNGNLLAIGRFDSISSGNTTIACNDIAQWDGIAWSSLELPDSLYDNAKFMYQSLSTIVVAKDGTIFVEAYDRQNYSSSVFEYRNKIWRFLKSFSMVSDGKFSMALDSAGTLYINQSNTTGIYFSKYDGLEWNQIAGPPSTSTSYSITNLTALPDNSIYCCIENSLVMRFSLNPLPIIAMQKRHSEKQILAEIRKEGIIIKFIGVQSASNLTASLFNLHGQILKKITAFPTQTKVAIPLKGLPHGAYIIDISCGKQKLFVPFTTIGN